MNIKKRILAYCLIWCGNPDGYNILEDYKNGNNNKKSKRDRH